MNYENYIYQQPIDPVRQAILLAIVIALISLVQFKLMGTDVEY